MIYLQFVFLVLTATTCSCTQASQSIANHFKANSESNYLEDGLKIPVSVLMLEPYDGEVSMKILDESIAGVKPVLGPAGFIGSGPQESVAQSLPDTSALDESFPKIEVSSSNRHRFHKTIRSPCSQQDDSGSNSNDESSNLGDSSDNDNSVDKSLNLNIQSDDSNSNADNENVQSTSNGNSVNPEDSDNDHNDNTDLVRRGRGSNDLMVDFVTSESNSTDSQNPLRSVHNSKVSSNLSSGLSKSGDTNFNSVTKSHHNLNKSITPEEDNHKNKQNFNESDTPEALMTLAPPSIALLNLPSGSVYAVPNIDTPAHLIANNKRAIQKSRPILKRKSLKSIPEHSEVPDVTSESASGFISDKEVLHEANFLGSNQEVPEKTSKAYVPRANKNLRKKQIAPKSTFGSPTDGLLSSNVLNTDEKSQPVEGGLPVSSFISNPQNDEPSTSVNSSQALQSSLKDKKMALSRKQEHIPCTCGVFLSGQFTKGARTEPNGNPVIEHQLEQTFPCSTAGKNQCQNKCLDMMVKHLPNSGTIICGSIDKDIYKEKAYLWVKNCHDIWVNTNLSSGKEHCCKNNQPIKCSLME